jgi:hypothetical protein
MLTNLRSHLAVILQRPRRENPASQSTSASRISRYKDCSAAARPRGRSSLMIPPSMAPSAQRGSRLKNARQPVAAAQGAARRRTGASVRATLIGKSRGSAPDPAQPADIAGSRGMPFLTAFRIAAELADQAAEDDCAVSKRGTEPPRSRRSISFQISLKISFRTSFSMPCPGAASAILYLISR